MKKTKQVPSKVLTPIYWNQRSHIPKDYNLDIHWHKIFICRASQQFRQYCTVQQSTAQ